MSVYSNENVYKINYSKPGIVVIFNNMHFKEHQNKRDRKGSDIDVERLTRVFKELNYRVEIQADKTSQEMKDLVKTYAQRDYTNDSCFICFFMSHGKELENGKWIIKGTDSVDIGITESMNAFKFTDSLRNKPKLFFIQACRGETNMPTVSIYVREQKKIKITQNDNISANNQNTEQDCVSGMNIDVLKETLEENFLTKSDESRVSEQFPDFLLASSTVEKYFAFRNRISGSSYIQAFCDVLIDTENKTLNINDMLTLVNTKLEIISQEFINISMVSKFENWLKKLFFLYQEVSYEFCD